MRTSSITIKKYYFSFNKILNMNKGIYEKLQPLLLPHSVCLQLIFIVLPVGPNALNITNVYGWLQGTMAYIFKRDFFLLTDNTFKTL